MTTTPACCRTKKPSLKAVFDARWIKSEPSGIGVYAEAIASRLPALLPGFEFVFLVRDDATDKLVAGLRSSDPAGRASTVRVSHGPLSPNDALWLSWFLRNCGAAVYHTPNFMAPSLRFFGWKGKIFATIHDVIPLIVPDYAPNSKTARMKALFRFCLRSTAKAANTLWTVSETSKRDIVSSLRLPPPFARRVQAVHNGVAKDFFTAGAQPRPPLPPTQPRTLLYVGRRDPYKNVPFLVEVFAEALRKAPWPLRLVLAGAPDPRYPEAEAAAERLGVSAFVHSTGSIDHNDLVKLYREADLLVHPSRYEGFGLQIAEAFACSLAVVCGDGGSVPEVAGNAARIVPLDAGKAAWADAIIETLGDESALANMRQAGRRRAENFTWDRAASTIAAKYI